MDEIYIALADVPLYNDIIENGIEIYTSQDGLYAEYELDNDTYILDCQEGYLTIQMKEEE
jgi:hypothetical protein